MGVWRGWIRHYGEKDTRESAKEVLERMGITLGEYRKNTSDIPGSGEFQNCSLSDESLQKLDSFWGRFIWGLEQEGA